MHRLGSRLRFRGRRPGAIRDDAKRLRVTLARSTRLLLGQAIKETFENAITR
jgi:hypothetical protein